MQTLTLLPGRDKAGKPEPFDQIALRRGELCTIVGNTGSGKSRLIKDIEQLSDGTGVTGRRVLLDDGFVPLEQRQAVSTSLVAHLGQNMRFVLDTSACTRPAAKKRSAKAMCSPSPTTLRPNRLPWTKA